MSDPVIHAGVSPEGLAITRLFAAPPQLVFDAWTKPEQFALWFGEDGSFIEDAHMDVTPGGKWGVVMVIPAFDNMRMPFLGEFVEIDPFTKIVMAMANPQDPSSPVREILTVLLKEVDGGTEMTFTQGGNNLPPEQYEMTKDGYLKFFVRLAALVEAS